MKRCLQRHDELGVNWGKALPLPRIDTANMPEVRELESKNLHNQMWTFTSNCETSLLDTIFRGNSPFDDGGKLEVIDGFSEGAEIPHLPDASQEFASGLDFDLMRLTQELQANSKKIINSHPYSAKALAPFSFFSIDLYLPTQKKTI